MFDNILCRFLCNRSLMTIRYHVSKLPISPLIHVDTTIAQICQMIHDHWNTSGFHIYLFSIWFLFWLAIFLWSNESKGNSNHLTPMRVWQVKGKREEDSPWLRKKLLVMLSFFSFSWTSTQKRCLKVTVIKIFVHSHLMWKELIKAHFSRCDLQDKEGHDSVLFQISAQVKTKQGQPRKCTQWPFPNVPTSCPAPVAAQVMARHGRLHEHHGFPADIAPHADALHW